MPRHASSRLAFYIVAIVSLFGLTAVSPALHFTTPPASTTAVTAQPLNRILTFADRVTYQKAIEEVYWRHRIWPKERTDSKPLLDSVMSRRQIETKVRDYLRNSRVLEDYWQQPISPEQLQGEMERMTQHTKNPEMLRELFEALGNDPYVAAECLARPVLSERLAREFYETKRNPSSNSKLLDESPQSQSVRVGNAASNSPVVGGYRLPALTNAASTCTDDTWSSMIDLPARRANHSAVWTGSEMIVWGGRNYDQSIGTGDRYNPATDSWSKVTSTNAPIARDTHTAVWTGTEMVIWGGYTVNYAYTNTGGRYDPANDSWTP